MGGVLGQFGLRAIPFGIAAMLLSLVLVHSAGTEAGPADTALPDTGTFVFATIHPGISRVRAALKSEATADRVRLASLAPQVGFDVPDPSRRILTPTSACRSALLDERFAALEARPASASGDECLDDRGPLTSLERPVRSGRPDNVSDGSNVVGRV